VVLISNLAICLHVISILVQQSEDGCKRDCKHIDDNNTC